MPGPTLCISEREEKFDGDCLLPALFESQDIVVAGMVVSTENGRYTVVQGTPFHNNLIVIAFITIFSIDGI